MITLFDLAVAPHCRVGEGRLGCQMLQKSAPEVYVTPSSDAAKIDASGLVDVCVQRRSLCDGV